jgi:hypothetical protein
LFGKLVEVGAACGAGNVVGGPTEVKVIGEVSYATFQTIMVEVASAL